MVNEHNPVALLVYKIQDTWLQQISPRNDIHLIKWMIKPEDISLYRGFIQLENTEHGRVPEGIHALFTPFSSETVHSKHLMQHFIESIEKDTETEARLKANGISFSWDKERYLKMAQNDSLYDVALLEMLQSFKAALFPQETKLVIALMPNTVKSYAAYKRWLSNLLNIGIPDGICFLEFDDEQKKYYSDIDNIPGVNIVTFKVPVDLQSALRKAATSAGGGGNQVAATLNDYLFKMGDALAENNKAKLDKIAARGVDFAVRQSSPSLQATILIVHAGMLLNFKDYDLMETQLNKSLRITQKGIADNDESCKSLLLQVYAYLSMLFHHKKNFEKSIDYLLLQAATAEEYHMYPMAISAYYQAVHLTHVHNYQHRRHDILPAVLSTSKKMSVADLRLTQFITLGYDWYQIQKAAKKEEEVTTTDQYMQELYGKDWLLQAKEAQQQLHYVKDAAKIFAH